jgi:hypothetical protein
MGHFLSAFVANYISPFYRDGFLVWFFFLFSLSIFSLDGFPRFACFQIPYPPPPPAVLQGSMWVMFLFKK